MDIIRSDKSRCRPPKSEWSLDDRTDRAGSGGAEWGWVGRPLRRLPRFATDGRGRMREATLHHNMDGWLGGSTNPSRSPLLVSQLASQSGKEGRERGTAPAEVGEWSVDWYVGLSPSSRGKQTGHGLLSVGCCPPQVESECLTRDERGSALLRRSR